MAPLRRLYGAGIGHLLALVASFALAAYVVDRVVRVPYAWMILVFFLGAIVAHDFVLYPIYALADRAIRRLDRRGSARTTPRLVNHVRVPALLSGLLLLLFFPLVLGLGERTYRAATGLDTSPYLGRWLMLTGIFFTASGLLYVWRRWRARRPESGRNRAPKPPEVQR